VIDRFCIAYPARLRPFRRDGAPCTSFDRFLHRCWGFAPEANRTSEGHHAERDCSRSRASVRGRLRLLHALLRFVGSPLRILSLPGCQRDRSAHPSSVSIPLGCGLATGRLHCPLRVGSRHPMTAGGSGRPRAARQRSRIRSCCRAHKLHCIRMRFHIAITSTFTS